MGVKIHLNTAIGKDISLKELQEKFDAVFLGIGAWKSAPLGIPGEQFDGVVPALDLLKTINLGGTIEVPKNVVVLGGGNAAMDAARTLLRLGSEQ